MHNNKMQIYLEKYYLTTEQLLNKTAISIEELAIFLKKQCIPGASYQLTSTRKYSSPINITAYDETTDYFHPSVMDWINSAKILNKKHKTDKISESVKHKFYSEYELFFPNNEKTPNCDDVDTAWKYLINGTWGICLREISVAYISLKQKARQYVANIMLSKNDDILTAQEKKLLVTAIDNYEKATMPFDPDFRPSSSREKEIIPAINRFGLMR